MDMFANIEDERRSVAKMWRTLSVEQQQAQSLCEAWTVHEVAAHLLMPLETGVARFSWAMITSGGNFDRANLKLTARVAKRPFSQIIEDYETRARSRFTPPGLGPIAPLTDVTIHAQDMCVPLGIEYRTSDERMRAVLDHIAEHGLSGKPSNRFSSLRLEATDLDWSHGEGPEVRGPAHMLLLSLSGRAMALDSLEGDGLETLRSLNR